MASATRLLRNRARIQENIKKAQGHGQAGDWDDSWKLLVEVRQELHEAGIESSFVYWLSGVAGDYTQHWAEALGFFRRALELDPFNIHHIESKGIVTGRIHRFLCQPDQDLSQEKIGHLYALLCEEEEAGRDSHLAAVRHFLVTGNTDRAAVIIDAVRALYPRNPDVLRLSVEVASRQQDMERASLLQAELDAVRGFGAEA